MVVFSLVIVYYYLSIGDATWRVTRGQTLGGVSQCAAAAAAAVKEICGQRPTISL